MNFDPKAARAAIERARNREQRLPGDPIEAIAKARADAPKRLTAKKGLFGKKKPEFADMRDRLQGSVIGRPGILDAARDKMPVDPPEVEYIAHRRISA